MAKLALIRGLWKIMLLVLVLCFFNYWGAGFHWWITIAYPFFQSIRCWVFDFIPFSLGDLFYILLGLVLLVGLLVALYPVALIHRYKQKAFVRLGVFMFVVASSGISFYIYFLLSWGGHYYREPIGKTWGLDTSLKVNLAVFERDIIAQINTLQPFYRSYGIDRINEVSLKNYEAFTDCKFNFKGHAIKSSLFGSYVDKMGIEGYFNPFTGEGQIGKLVPTSILPFVISHEIAHKAGIAREGDANLVAYAICTQSDSTFRYSAAMDLLLYVRRRFSWVDSTAESKLFAQLNTYSRRQLDTIYKYFDLSKNAASDAGREMYDDYLKLQQQKEGIRSYGNIVADAWRLELRRKKIGVERVKLF